MIGFLSPLFLAGVVAVAVPLVLHLLKRDTEVRVKFSAVRLLLGATAEDTEKRRLRELLLLALRIAALVLLAFAFARPFVRARGAGQPAGVTIVALDTSLSMSAPGQFARAEQLAKEAIARASGDAVGVITFAGATQVLTAPSVDRALASAAVDRASTGFGATRYRAALNTAAQLITAAGAPRANVVVVTDLQETGWDAGDRVAIPESARVEIVDVGTPPANLAVTGIRQEDDRIVATIRNTDSRERQAHVRLAVDGRAAGDATASIGANQAADVSLAGARGTTAAATVDDFVGIQGDNTRYLVLNGGGGARLPVGAVTTNGDLSRDAFYLEQGLNVAAAKGASYLVEGIDTARLSTLTQDQLAEKAVLVLLSTKGLERHGRDLLSAYVAKGGGLLAALGDQVDGEALAAILAGTSLEVGETSAARNGDSVTLAPADARHPVFQVFGRQAAALGLVTFKRFATISGAGCQTLARFSTGGAALLDCASGDGRALVFASDLDNRWNDFPVHATFVPFLHEAIRYLAGTHPRRDEYLVGDGLADLPVTPGIATLPGAAGSEPRRVAVNVDPNEGEPRRMSPADFQTAVGRLKDADGSVRLVKDGQEEDRQHVWQYLLALMVMGLVVEGFVGRRA